MWNTWVWTKKFTWCKNNRNPKKPHHQMWRTQGARRLLTCLLIFQLWERSPAAKYFIWLLITKQSQRCDCFKYPANTLKNLNSLHRANRKSNVLTSKFLGLWNWFFHSSIWQNRTSHCNYVIPPFSSPKQFQIILRAVLALMLLFLVFIVCFFWEE